MVHLHKKKIKGRVYYYLREMAWVDGKPKVAWQKYLGSAEKIQEMFERAEGAGATAKIKSYEYGRTAALLTISEELGFVDAVNDNTTKKRDQGLTVGEYSLLILLGRCEGPNSKQQIGEWVSEHSFLRLAWSFPHKLNTQNFINHTDYLLTPQQHESGEAGAIPAIEEDIGRNLVGRGIKPTTLIWDTTNMVTYVDRPGALIRPGKSKQGQTGKNLIGLGICVSKENIPLLHEMYPANMNDAKLFPRIIDRITERLTRLNVDLKEQLITLVFDKGNNSNDSIAAILERMHVVGALKKEQAKDMIDIPLNDFEHLYANEKGHEIKGCRRDDVPLFGEKHLFAWNEVPEDKECAGTLRSFLEDALGADWAGESRITKSTDGKTMTASSGENWIRITLGDWKRTRATATLETCDGRTRELTARKKKGVIDVYGKELFSVIVTYNKATHDRQLKTYERNKKKILEGLAELKEKAARIEGQGRRMTEKGLHSTINDLIKKDYQALFDYKVREKEVANSKGKSVTVLELTYQLNKDKEAERRKGFGRNLVFTDNAKMSSEEIARTYNSKAVVEDDMKWLKGKLLISVTPHFSSKENRIRVHVFLCVMGLLFYRYLAWRLKDFGLSPQRLIEELESIRVAVVKQKGSNKVGLRFEEMTPIQARLFSALDLGSHLKIATTGR